MAHNAIQERTRTEAVTVRYTLIESPLGAILVAGNDEGIRIMSFQEGTDPVKIDPAWERRDEAFLDAAGQLADYFAGLRRDFDLPLAPRGTAFQLRVWRELTRIPYGETISYGELARRIDKPQAMRAVGSANGSNPLPLIVPCHRVIGANGKLTGYHGGLGIKRFLLSLEAQHQDALFVRASATHPTIAARA
jgi:methylated-DNA-[protein]-cysteine S-methyltransferase